MPYFLFMSYRIMWTLISLPLQMAERLRRAQPDSVANHVKARQSLIERAVTWLATESGWARGKRSAICSGKLCEGFSIFEQRSPCVYNPTQFTATHVYAWYAVIFCRGSFFLSNAVLSDHHMEFKQTLPHVWKWARCENGWAGVKK